jgi:hypothetical protein
MSHTSHCFIEARFGNGDSWFLVAKMYLYGDVDVDSVLAYPWGKFHGKRGALEGEDGNIRPVAPGRGVPTDLCLITRHEYAWLILEPRKRAYGERRTLTSTEAKQYSKRWKRFGKTHLWLLPDEWHGATWLTLPEVEEANRRVKTVKHRISYELESILGVMRAQMVESRLIIWYS